MARTISSTELRKNFNREMERVADEHQPLFINRPQKENMVLISESDFSALDETAYLLRSSENARRLAKAIASKKRVKAKSFKDLRSDLGI